jgi:hypothetical protein
MSNVLKISLSVLAVAALALVATRSNSVKVRTRRMCPSI